VGSGDENMFIGFSFFSLSYLHPEPQQTHNHGGKWMVRGEALQTLVGISERGVEDG